MYVSNDRNNSLRHLPPVHGVLADSRVAPLAASCGRDLVAGWIREAVDSIRSKGAGASLDSAEEGHERVVAAVVARSRVSGSRRLGRVINATGVILHTGLGRAPLSEDAKRAIVEAAGTCNLELDLETGDRRSRGYQLLDAWRTLTGCEDALIVNNNAAATLLVLQGLCAGREVILSRGQLIEIGGSFRLPDIFQLSGARLREVGTTNRTRLSDYEQAIGPDTAAILRVHPSNYRIVGFTESPSIEELVGLARSKGILILDDIGSGCLADLTQLGLPHEPRFQESLSAGADVVLGSGDKLLGGPQAGIILGRKSLVEPLRKHPLARAVRVDKLTLAALAATLDAALHGHAGDLPVHQLLSAGIESLEQRAASIVAALGSLSSVAIQWRRSTAPVGGGSMPGADLRTVVVALAHSVMSAAETARALRIGRLRVMPRVSQDEVLLDLRSVLPADDAVLIAAVREAF